MRRRGILLAAAIISMMAASLSELAAQQPVAWVLPRAGEPMTPSGPFAVLLAQRAEVGLSDAQVRSIGEIARRLVQENEPLMAQIRDAEVWGVETDQEAEALAAVREQFREHAVAAEAEVEELLTEEQREIAHEIFDGASLAYPTPEARETEDAEAEDGPPARDRRAAAPPTTVTVENRHYNDVTIYVHSGSFRQRLGRVTGLRTETFNIPPSVVAGLTSLRFEVRALAQPRSSVSDHVTVHEGDQVRLQIPPTLR